MKVIIHDTDSKVLETEKPLVISFPEDKWEAGIQVHTLKQILEDYFKYRDDGKSFRINEEKRKEATVKVEFNPSTDYLTALKDLLLVHLNNDPLRDYLQQLDPKIDELIRSLKSQ